MFSAENELSEDGVDNSLLVNCIVLGELFHMLQMRTT